MPADEPFALVIFGASGDLTKRKLVPALWSLFQGRVLPEPFVIIGVARSPMSHDEFRHRMREAVTEFARVQPPASHVWDRFASCLYYCPGVTDDPALYVRLGALLRELETDKGTGGNRLFYCATPPSLYPEIVTRLGASGIHRETNGWVRIIIEKPFGRDRATPMATNGSGSTRP